MVELSKNIVLVVMDTARAKNFPFYGHENDTAPFLSSLARDNVLYEHVISQSNWTLPSHASMFTGEYVSEHEASLGRSFSDLGFFTEELSERGYTNIAITNVTYLSEEFNFDEYFDDFTHLKDRDFLHDMAIERERFESGKERYEEFVKQVFREKRFSKLVQAPKHFLDERIFLSDDGAKETNKLVKEKLSGQDDPFFLFLNYLEPHAPYKPPQPFTFKFSGPKMPQELLDVADGGPEFLSSEMEPEEGFYELAESLYDAEIYYLDRKLRELYEYISQEFPDTVFIFTADHGEYFYEHKRVLHATDLFEEVAHVPMLEVFPDQRSETIEGQIELRDLRDHILSISEGNLEPIEPDSFSVSEFFGLNPEDYPAGEAFTGEDEENFSRYQAAINSDSHKLVWYSDGEKILYNLPEQEEIEDEGVVENLSEELKDRVGCPEDKEGLMPGEHDVDDEEIKESLKKLGYVG